MLESECSQPLMTFGGDELYPTIVEKASAPGFSLVKNHPFVDGNKRISHAAMETSLVLNNHEVDAPVDEQERVIFGIASSELGRDDFIEWLRTHISEKLV